MKISCQGRFYEAVSAYYPDVSHPHSYQHIPFPGVRLYVIPICMATFGMQYMIMCHCSVPSLLDLKNDFSKLQFSSSFPNFVFSFFKRFRIIKFSILRVLLVAEIPSSIKFGCPFLSGKPLLHFFVFKNVFKISKN